MFGPGPPMGAGPPMGGGPPPPMDRRNRDRGRDRDRDHHRGGPGRGRDRRGGPRGERQVCKHFVQHGRCSFGDDCRFLHPGVNGPPLKKS